MEVDFNHDTYVQVLEKLIPFHGFINLKVLELKEGYCKMEIPFNPVLVGDPRTQRWHGGIVATILDAVGGASGFHLLNDPSDKISTMDMRVDYLNGGKPEPIIAQGWLTRKGNHSFHCKSEAYNKSNPSRIIAQGSAVLDIKIKNSS